MTAKFGPAGNSEIFYNQGHKSSIEAPQWLRGMGLDAYEYPCSRGVNIKEETARKIGENAVKFNIELSIHAPYYINLSSTDSSRIERSVKYIADSCMAAKWMGAKRVVFHPGSCSKMDRAAALCIAKDGIKRTLKVLEEIGCQDITICPETMGKQNQLGTLSEVIEMCRMDERLMPTVDFGHINALSHGSLKTIDDYRKILEDIKNSLGEYRFMNLHCHFSRIEFTDAGEKKHWTLNDTMYGPEFEPLAELIYEYGMSPVVICESRGTMAEDALKLKIIYERISKYH